MLAHWLVRGTPTASASILLLSLLVLSLLAAPGPAWADDCGLLGGVAIGGECRIAADIAASGTYTIASTLRILGTGRLVVPPTVPPSPPNTLTLTVGGALIVDPPLLPGFGAIVGDAGPGNPGGVGATLTLTASGDIVLRGGALVSSHGDPSLCAGGRAGAVTLTSTAGRVTVEPGARVLANSECAGGALALTAQSGDVEIGGLVEAAGGGSGAVPAATRGGAITLAAGGRLTVAVTGRISSRGLAAGADLVHLESGLDMTLRGVVESQGGVDNGGATTGCTARAGKPAGSTACLELWAGRALLIDGTGLTTSVLTADAGGLNTPGVCCSWLDIFARDDVTIAGPALTGRNPVFAVSARQGSPDAPGGQLTVTSVAGRIVASGVALTADSVGGGTGTGGSVLLQAAANVDLNDAIVLATGPGAGGVIAIRSFNGTLTGQAPGLLAASFDSTGLVEVQVCIPSTYTDPPNPGTILPPPGTFLAPQCGGAPALPAYAVLPKPAPTITITGGTFVQGVSAPPFAATASAVGAAGEPVGPLTITYATDTGTPLPGPPTAVGTYVATASFAGDATYRPASAQAFIIVVPNTAPVTVISLTGGTFTYDGQPHPATGVVTGGGLTLGAAILAYVETASGLPVATPIDAGSYTVTATDPGFSGFQRAAPVTATLTILRHNPTFALSGGGTFVYDGDEHGVVGTARGVNNATLSPALTFLYGGSATIPRTTIGVFPVTATFAGNANYNPAADTSLTITLVKATPTVTVASATVPFTGAPQPVTGQVLGVGNPAEVLTPLIVRYDGSTDPPSASGVYTVVGEFPGNANYEQVFSAPAALTILGAIVPTITLSAGPFTYDGQPHPATGQVIGTGGAVIATPAFTYDGSPTPPVNAGAYALVASFAGDPVYAAVSVTQTLTIDKATPTVTISGAGEVPFDGQPHGVTAMVTGVPGEAPGPVTVTYNGSPTPPTQPGTYTVLAAYAGAANYNPASATATLTITGGPREACLLVDFREITYFRNSRVLTSSDAGIRARNGLHGGFAPGLWPYDPRGRGDSTPSRGTLFRIYGFPADQVGVRIPDADVATRSYAVKADHDIPGAYYVDLGGPARVIVCVAQLQRAIVDEARGGDDDDHDERWRSDPLPGSVVLSAAQKNVPGIMLSHNRAVIDVPKRVRDDLRTLGTPLRDSRGRNLDRGLVDYVAFQLWGGGSARYREFVDVQIDFLGDSLMDLAAHYSIGLLTAKNSSFESFRSCNYLDSAPGNDGVRFTDVWSERFDASGARACGRREPAGNQDVRENYDVPFGAIQLLPSVNTASDTVRLFFGAIRAPRR